MRVFFVKGRLWAFPFFLHTVNAVPTVRVSTVKVPTAGVPVKMVSARVVDTGVRRWSLVVGVLLLVIYLTVVPIQEASRGGSMRNVVDELRRYGFTMGSLQESQEQIVADNLAVSGDYTLRAVEIEGKRARLQLLPNVGHPTLRFESVKIRGLQLTHPLTADLTLAITAADEVVGNKVAIKTSLFEKLETALGSFVNKGDLLILIFGGTVNTLKMRNVSLRVDRSITAEYMLMPQLQVSIV